MIEEVKGKSQTELYQMLQSILGRVYREHPSPAWADVAIDMNTKQKSSKLYKMDRGDLAFLVIAFLKLEQSFIEMIPPKDTPAYVNHKWIHDTTEKMFFERLTNQGAEQCS